VLATFDGEIRSYLEQGSARESVFTTTRVRGVAWHSDFEEGKTASSACIGGRARAATALWVSGWPPPNVARGCPGRAGFDEGTDFIQGL
jgi:hypothetical protein